MTAFSAVRLIDTRSRFARLVGAVDWLRSHRLLVTEATVAGIAVCFVLDLLVPGYAIACLYVLPMTLVAFALDQRWAIAVALLCLALTVWMMIDQGRANGQNIMLVCLGGVGMAALIALAYLYDHLEDLYRRERLAGARMQVLTTQLQTLQEISVLQSDRPLADLLHHVVWQAQQLLESDAGILLRFDARWDLFRQMAAVGLSRDWARTYPPRLWRDEVAEAVLELRPVHGDCRAPARKSDGDEGASVAPAADRAPRFRTLLAVPLVAREDVYGAIALFFRERRDLSGEDVDLAQSFAQQAALAIENARLREQVAVSAVAAERSRLARDLHDSVTQSLFAAGLKADALLKACGDLDPDARGDLQDLQCLTRGALAEMRSLLLEMRPEALAGHKTAELMKQLAEATRTRTRTVVELTATGSHEPPLDVSLALYRIAREAMNNVVRHAHAAHVRLAVDCSRNGARLEVTDDGDGFQPEDVSAEHLGLLVMRERAEAVGAVLVVSSVAGEGTSVVVRWTRPQE